VVKIGPSRRIADRSSAVKAKIAIAYTKIGNVMVKAAISRSARQNSKSRRKEPRTEEKSTGLTFADNDKIPNWAEGRITGAVRKGIIEVETTIN
jgi:hypothetical protein